MSDALARAQQLALPAPPWAAGRGAGGGGGRHADKSAAARLRSWREPTSDNSTHTWEDRSTFIIFLKMNALAETVERLRNT